MTLHPAFVAGGKVHIVKSATATAHLSYCRIAMPHVLSHVPYDMLRIENICERCMERYPKRTGGRLTVRLCVSSPTVLSCIAHAERSDRGVWSNRVENLNPRARYGDVLFSIVRPYI